jgi:hypothetical protein
MRTWPLSGRVRKLVNYNNVWTKNKRYQDELREYEKERETPTGDSERKKHRSPKGQETWNSTSSRTLQRIIVR